MFPKGTPPYTKFRDIPKRIQIDILENYAYRAAEAQQKANAEAEAKAAADLRARGILPRRSRVLLAPEIHDWLLRFQEVYDGRRS